MLNHDIFLEGGLLHSTKSRYENTYYVSPYFTGISPFFESIQDAIDTASSGSLVKVGPGMYEEKITLKNGVDLFFLPGASIYIDDGSGTTPVIQGTNVNCKIVGKPDITIDDDPIDIRAVQINGSSIVSMELGIVTGDMLFDTLTNYVDVSVREVANVHFKDCNTTSACYFKANKVSEFAVTGVSTPSTLGRIYCNVKFFEYLVVRNIGYVHFNFEYGKAKTAKEAVVLKRGNLYLAGKVIEDANTFSAGKGTILVDPDMSGPVYQATGLEFQGNIKCTSTGMCMFLEGIVGINSFKNCLFVSGYTVSIGTPATPGDSAEIKVLNCATNSAVSDDLVQNLDTVIEHAAAVII